MVNDPQRNVLGRLTGAVTGRVIETIDPDLVLEHVDVNALLDRIDVDRLLDRVDIERLLDRVDVDRLLARADVEGLVRRSGVPDIVAARTGRFAGTALDLVRRQLLVLDVVFGKVVDGLFRRRRLGWTHAPVTLRPTGPRVSPDGRLDVSGEYAGPFTRLAAAVADIWIFATGATLLLAGVDYVGRTVIGRDLSADAYPGAWVVAFAVLGFCYVFLGIEVAGRTPGKSLVGLRVVAWDGSSLGVGASFVRTLALPVSAGVLGLGCLLALVHPNRRALHDLVARSAVVHDWTPRPAELPAALSRAVLGRR